MVEAAGVELIRVLTARNSLILGTATTARKAPLPNPLYVYCTKMLFALESHKHHIATTVSHRFAGIEKASTFLRFRTSPPFHFFGTPACRLDNFRVARHPPAEERLTTA